MVEHVGVGNHGACAYAINNNTKVPRADTHTRPLEIGKAAALAERWRYFDDGIVIGLNRTFTIVNLR